MALGILGADIYLVANLLSSFVLKIFILLFAGDGCIGFVSFLSC